MNSYDRILGGLLGGAIGDAMGAATETRSRQQIIERFGSPVTELITPPDDVFARGFEKGSVTDDFSLAYYTALEIIYANGHISDSVAEKALVSWSKTPYFALAGPTTVAAVNRILGNETESRYSFLTVDNSKGSNGSAMKIAPVGLASHGDVQKAIEDAITICKPTHFNSTSLAGGCAVAAAVSEAMHEDATVDTVIKAGLIGARQGNEYGCSHGRQLANPSVYKRIKLAVSIAEKYNGDIERTMDELADIIGCGLSAAEAVPVSFGLLKACNGDPMEVIRAAVNIGNDTDTIATIAGAIAGTLIGANEEMLSYLETIDEVNGFDLRIVASGLEMLGGQNE